MTTKPTERHASPAPALDNLRQLVLFRTIAIAGQIITVAFVKSVLHIPLPLLALAAGIGFLAVFNVATWIRLGIHQPVSDRELFGQGRGVGLVLKMPDQSGLMLVSKLNASVMYLPRRERSACIGGRCSAS